MHGGSRNKAETFSNDALDRWTPGNTDTDIPRVTTYSGKGSVDRASSTHFLRDGTYARFRNISLGYSLPSSVTSRLQLSRIRIYFTADNAITFFKYKKDGLEPEQDFNGSVNSSNMGVSSIISGGLQLSF